MRQYYIEGVMWRTYPYEERQRVEDYGVLSEYIGNLYDRETMDKVICEIFTRHPYIEGAMRLDISVMWMEPGKGSGFYHKLEFINFGYNGQVRGNPAIVYETM